MIPITRRASHSTRCTPFLCLRTPWWRICLTRISRISLISLWVRNLTEAGGGVAHTDSTDLADFFVGGESHRGRLSGGVPHTDPVDLTDFVVEGKSHRGWWSGWLYGLSDYSEFFECSEYSECSIFSFYQGKIVIREIRVIRGVQSVTNLHKFSRIIFLCDFSYICGW